MLDADLGRGASRARRASETADPGGAALDSTPIDEDSDVPEPARGVMLSVAGQSCRRGLVCGSGSTAHSCCDTIAVPAGTVLFGRVSAGGDAFNVPNPEELPEHPVAVPGFYLDRYEVTVGRFREFVGSWTGAPIPVGAGAHPAVPGSGWRAEWNKHLPSTSDAFVGALHCAAGQESWKDASGPDDNRPIGCLDWYEAFAFCIWDGGRLPVESEWEYAAAGGDRNGVYPWGFEAPDCTRVSPFDGCSEPGDMLAPVGLRPGGAGRWGHQDLAGGAEEWVLDYYDEYLVYLPGLHVRVDAPSLTLARRTLRGLSIFGGGGDMRAADRGNTLPNARFQRFGVRCARDVAPPARATP